MVQKGAELKKLCKSIPLYVCVLVCVEEYNAQMTSGSNSESVQHSRPLDDSPSLHPSNSKRSNGATKTAPDNQPKQTYCSMSKVVRNHRFR